MKISAKLLFTIIISCFVFLSAKAQDTNNDLMKQGVALHNQGKYTEAIDKFNEVLKADPENAYANYEIAFSLYAAKRPTDAISHLEKATKASDAKLSVAAYSLLATIYDENHEPQKAIETYKTAIKLDPAYPQIYYNLGVTYSRVQRYAEAEAAAIEAIKHNPQHANSQRLYALVTFHQNKRANALLGFCSFILMQPASPLAAEAYGNIQHIIQGGVLKDAQGNNTIKLSPGEEKENSALNLGISMSVLSGQTKKLQGVDLLEYQLKSIFSLSGQLAEKKSEKTFFDKFFVEYFYKLAQSNNMPAFTRTLTLSDKTIDNATWAKANAAQISAMADWLKNTPREF